MAKDTSFRVDDGSYNQLLNYGSDSPLANRRRHRSVYDGYASIANNFLREEIQPTLTRKKVVDQHTYSVSHSSLSVPQPKRCSCPSLVSEYIQQTTIQPFKATRSNDKEYKASTNMSETKKRPRPSYGRTKTTTTKDTSVELRIDGNRNIDTIEEIMTKASAVCANKSTSVCLKRIRSNLDDGNDTEESYLLLDALKELVQKKGFSWKRIRLQDCSPSILKVLLASPYCQNFEEIHISGMCEDEKDEPNHDQSILTESSPPSECEKTTITSSLIISLLKKSNRIKELTLKDCDLDNFDLIQFMNVLCSHPNHPKSLEHLDLRFNKFTPLALRSIVAIHLRSSLHSLKSLKLRQGLRCVVHRNVRDAVVQSLECNRVVLESIDVFDWDKSVQYRLDINRAKRRFIFCNNDRFPRTLWPLLLEKATVVNEDNGYDKMTRNQKSRSLPRSRNTSSTRRQASILYHMFRNGGPMLLEQQDSSTQNLGTESN